MCVLIQPKKKEITVGANEMFMKKLLFLLLLLSFFRVVVFAQATDAHPHVNNYMWVLIFMPLFIFFTLLIITIYSLRKFNLKHVLSENIIDKVTIKNEQYTAQNIKELLSAISPNAVPGNSGNESSPPVANNIVANNLNPAIIANIAGFIRPTIDISADSKDYRPSFSRLSAFIFGMLTISIILSMSCFFIYYFICNNQTPALPILAPVLITFVIGIVPYVFNKIYIAKRSNKYDL